MCDTLKAEVEKGKLLFCILRQEKRTSLASPPLKPGSPPATPALWLHNMIYELYSHLIQWYTGISVCWH